MKTAWRLTRDIYQDQAMSGNGGLYAPGRWHSQGSRIIYSSSSLALATLELFVNLHNRRMLAHYVKSRILIPESLIAQLETEVLTAFLRDPDVFSSRSYGDAWLREGRSCVLEVPSRIVAEESNYLINPLHADFRELIADTDSYEPDPRLYH